MASHSQEYFAIVAQKHLDLLNWPHSCMLHLHAFVSYIVINICSVTNASINFTNSSPWLLQSWLCNCSTRHSGIWLQLLLFHLYITCISLHSRCSLNHRHMHPRYLFFQSLWFCPMTQMPSIVCQLFHQFSFFNFLSFYNCKCVILHNCLHWLYNY